MIKDKINVELHFDFVQCTIFLFCLDVIIDKDQDINALLQDGKYVNQFKNDDSINTERIYEINYE